MKSSKFWVKEFVLNEFTVFKGITPAVDRVLHLARSIASIHRCSYVVVDCVNNELYAVHPQEDRGDYISTIIVDAIHPSKPRKEIVCQNCLVI